MTDEHELPEFHEMGIVAARLLLGVIYASDGAAWDILLTNETELGDYFARIGLSVVIDRSEELAYLRQFSESERTAGYERIPKLFRRSPLTYDASLLCVVLRDEYRRFEEEDLDNARCVVEFEVLFEAWKSFFPSEADEVQLRRKLQTSLHKLEDLKFVVPFESEGGEWEVCKILKARLPLEDLELLRDRLLSAERETA